MRRLPIYLLVDCSESMAGEAIRLVEEGLGAIVSSLRSNPAALETVYLSLITFSRLAQQLVPLTEVSAFQVPKLTVKPGTAMGAALRLLGECMQREIVKTTPEAKGDYKPLVFLMTDGQPTDDWESGHAALSQRGIPHFANIYAIGCGPDIDTAILRRVSDIVLTVPDMTPECMKKVFVWLSASVQTASVRAGDTTSVRGKLADLPPELTESVNDSVMCVAGTPTRQAFLHARCQRTKKPYLMRYVYVSEYEIYQPVAAHPLEDLEEGDEAMLPPINSSLLNGAPPCPYCENPGAGMCSCGALFCVSGKEQGPTMCPKCGTLLTGGSEGRSFDIQRTEG
jgi:uncharacterized protein YegL